MERLVLSKEDERKKQHNREGDRPLEIAANNRVPSGTMRLKNCKTRAKGQRPASSDRHKGDSKTKPVARDTRYVRKYHRGRSFARC